VTEQGSTVLGGYEVPVFRYDWQAGTRQPYKKTYNLLPGQNWRNAETTDDQWEYYVLQDDREQIPVGALIAREMIDDGAIFAVFTEMWASKFVMINHELNAVTAPEEVKSILVEIKKANDGKLSGFPDVFGLYDNGNIVFREAKYIGTKDTLKQNQHEFAKRVKEHFGDRVQFAVVEWGDQGAKP